MKQTILNSRLFTIWHKGIQSSEIFKLFTVVVWSDGSDYVDFDGKLVFLLKALIWRLHQHSSRFQTKDNPAIGHKCKSQFQLEVFIGLFSSPVAGIALCYFKCLSFMDVAAGFSSTGHITHYCNPYRKSWGMFNGPALYLSVTTDQMMKVLNTDTHKHKYTLKYTNV